MADGSFHIPRGFGFFFDWFLTGLKRKGAVISGGKAAPAGSHMMKEERRKRKRKGFMILELIIVVAIIGVLAAMAVPNLTGLTDEAKVARIRSDISTLGTAAEVYYVKNGAYPASLDSLVGSKEEGYLKKVPEPPDKTVTYEMKEKGEVVASFKGKTYSSFGTVT